MADADFAADWSDSGATTSDRRERDLLAAYLTAFKPRGLVPILGRSDLRAGDAVTGFGRQTLCRRTDSFTNLVAWEAPATLQSVEVAADAAACFAMGVAADDDGLHAVGDRGTALRFDSVTVECVSRTSLRQSLRPDAHPAIMRLFSNLPVELDDDVILLGQVFRATCTLRIDRHQGSTSLPRLQALASRSGLRLRPVAGRSLRHADVLELATIVPRPVVFRPAFIEAGPMTPDTFRTMHRMQPRPAARNFDPDRDADVQALADWVDRQYTRLTG